MKKRLYIHDILSMKYLLIYRKQFFIPKGFDNVFITVIDSTEVFYKMDEYSAPGFDGAILWNDPEHWGIQNTILSDKDLNVPTLDQSSINF